MSSWTTFLKSVERCSICELKILIFLKDQIGLHTRSMCWFVDVAKWNNLINFGYHQHVVHHKILHLWHCSKMSYNICVLHHPNHLWAFDVHVCELQPPSFWVRDLQNYKQLMPLVHPKGIDNYKIFNNAPKFCYQHYISMYKFIPLYSRQFSNSHMTEAISP